MDDYKLYFQTAPYDELCGCVAIPLTENEERILDFAESHDDREKFMRGVFKKGRERTYLADCPNCDTGIRI